MNTLTHPLSNVSTSDLLLITLDALRCYVVMNELCMYICTHTLEDACASQVKLLPLLYVVNFERVNGDWRVGGFY